jgi:glutamate:GABA antiporter
MWDLVAMNIVAVVGLRWISRSARAGAPSVTLWILAWLLFFLPMALTLIELSSRYPEEGGMYRWARRAFGPVHGFLCGWCVWVNNLFYFPSLLLFVAANVLLVFGPGAASLADSRVYSTAFVLGSLWVCVFLNLLGLEILKRLHAVGSIATWLPASLLIVAGAAALVTSGSATSFSLPSLLPSGDVLTTISLWSAMCFAFSGFEIGGFLGDEIKDARRTLPRATMIAGALVTLIYIAGSASVLIAVPASALQERSGIADAVDLIARNLGLIGMGAVTGGLLALGSFAGTNSWFGGAARVPFAAGVDRALPAWFARLDPRRQTPRNAILVQGVLASLIFLVSVFLSVSGGQTTIQEAYDIMVNLTIMIYFVPYMYLFVTVVRLRPAAGEIEQPGVLRIPGGRLGLYLVAGSGFMATAISVALLFVPPSGTENALNYEANLIGQALIVLAAGVSIYWYSAVRDEGRGATDEGRGTKDEGRGTKDEGRRAKNV